MSTADSLHATRIITEGKVMFMSRAKIALFIVATSIWSGEVLAGSVTLTLTSKSRTSFTDPGGITQQNENGLIQTGGAFFIVRRAATTFKFEFGTTKISLIFPNPTDPAAPPESITIDGAHNISNNGFKGSVSATSPAYSWVRGAVANLTVSAGVETLVIRWTGSDQLVIP